MLSKQQKCATLGDGMALFLNQNERRTQLQEKIAAELAERVKQRKSEPGEVGEGILENAKEANNRSLAWVGIITVAVIALVIVVFIYV